MEAWRILCSALICGRAQERKPCRAMKGSSSGQASSSNAVQRPRPVSSCMKPNNVVEQEHPIQKALQLFPCSFLTQNLFPCSLPNPCTLSILECLLPHQLAWQCRWEVGMGLRGIVVDGPIKWLCILFYSGSYTVPITMVSEPRWAQICLNRP